MSATQFMKVGDLAGRLHVAVEGLKCGRSSWMMESRPGWLMAIGRMSGARARA